MLLLHIKDREHGCPQGEQNGYFLHLEMGLRAKNVWKTLKWQFNFD